MRNPKGINTLAAAAWLLACLANVAQGQWHHLMTIDPSDGQTSWHYTSHLWYGGGYGRSDRGDFINDTVRYAPIEELNITSTSSSGDVAWKVWTLSDDFKG